MSKMNLVKISEMIEDDVLFEDIASEESMVERFENYAWYDGDFEEWLGDNGIEMVGCNEEYYLLEDDNNFATVQYIVQENRFCSDCGDEEIFDFSTLKVFDKFQ